MRAPQQSTNPRLLQPCAQHLRARTLDLICIPCSTLHLLELVQKLERVEKEWMSLLAEPGQDKTRAEKRVCRTAYGDRVRNCPHLRRGAQSFSRRRDRQPLRTGDPLAGCNADNLATLCLIPSRIRHRRGVRLQERCRYRTAYQRCKGG